jgi:hypothetical protein
MKQFLLFLTFVQISILFTWIRKIISHVINSMINTLVYCANNNFILERETKTIETEENSDYL